MFDTVSFNLDYQSKLGVISCKDHFVGSESRNLLQQKNTNLLIYLVVKSSKMVQQTNFHSSAQKKKL